MEISSILHTGELPINNSSAFAKINAILKVQQMSLDIKSIWPLDNPGSNNHDHHDLLVSLAFSFRCG